MKSSTTQRFRYLALVLIVGGFLGWLLFHHEVASTAELAQRVRMKKPPQQRTIRQKEVLPLLRASGKEPPEFARAKEVRAPAKARPQPTTQELLDKISKQPGGKEKVAAAMKGKLSKTVLPASGKEPPEFARAKEVRAPAKARPQPTTKQLLNKVRLLPGGEQKIQRLKQLRPNINMGPGKKGSLWSWFAHLNPFRTKEAHAQNYSLTLTPKNDRCYEPWYGSLRLYGATYSGCYSSIELTPYDWPEIGGSKVYKPLVSVHFSVPASGYYLINFETWGYGEKAHLKNYTYMNNAFTYTTIESWDTMPERKGYCNFFDHPDVLNMERGFHSFYFIIDEGGLVYFCRVTITKI